MVHFLICPDRNRHHFIDVNLPGKNLPQLRNLFGSSCIISARNDYAPRQAHRPQRNRFFFPALFVCFIDSWRNARVLRTILLVGHNAAFSRCNDDRDHRIHDYIFPLRDPSGIFCTNLCVPIHVQLLNGFRRILGNY